MPINLELSASVGFIHKESIIMHGHTVLKDRILLVWTAVDNDQSIAVKNTTV
jgi:hypothetical protein